MKKKYVRKSKRRYSKRRYSKRRYSKRRYSKRRNRVSRVSRKKLKKRSNKSRKKSSRAGSSPLASQDEKVEQTKVSGQSLTEEDKLQEGPSESNRVYLTYPIQIFRIDYSRSGVYDKVPIKSQKEFNVYIDNDEEDKLFIVWINGENSTTIQISVPMIKKIKQEGKNIIFKIYSCDGENSLNALEIKVKTDDEKNLAKFTDFEFPKDKDKAFFFIRRR